MRLAVVLFCLLLASCSNSQEVATTVEPATSSTPPATQPESTTTTTTSASSTSSTQLTTTTSLPELQSLSLQSIGAVDFPVQVVSRPGEEVSYVVSKAGIIFPLVGDEIGAEPVLDISNLVRNSGEQGLLAMALHPTESELLYVHYSDGAGDTVIAEYTLSDPAVADPESARILLQVDQPAGNHNGGMIMFDPDGSLLIGLGDGGGANDRFGNGQNTETLLGGLVRLDVESGDAQLFNYGLRNPWRFWIDDNKIYVADVGQNMYEEISIVELAPDINFGWPITEGVHCFDPPSGCDTSGLTLPVVEVSHSDAGSCSITGGVVYRGAAIPEIDGQFFFSDYCGGYLRSVSLVGEGAEVEVTDWTDQVGVPGRVSGFGVDGQGEMYMTTESEVFRVVAQR
jgi:glucose/arabinose dehydrogenase